MKKVSSPLFIKVAVNDSVLISVGTPKHICDTFGISTPMFVNTIPSLIEGKIKGSSVSVIDYVEFRNLHSRVSDSNSGVALV